MSDAPDANARWPRIKTLFAEAVEQPPDAVDAWLDAHCGGDPELRRELKSLLASHQSAAGFLEAPAIAAPGAALAVSQRVAPSIRAAMVDRRIGAYRLLAELGRGGMGVVYLAERDDEAFSRRVAIKTVHGGVLHPSLLDRFHAERRILARLEHPNIAQLLDAGTDESGAPFAVMEYVEGTPIDRYVLDHRLSIPRRLELFCTVCDAVQYSHEHLVVHRDIKPGNILVTADGVPKLLDFGIAKLLEPSGIAPDRTRTELRALTPESASPEQVRGDPTTVATDVYSLGVLLFRLLTDKSPLPGTLRTDHEVVHAICNEAAPRPSEALPAGHLGLSPRAIAAWRRALQGDLDLITIKALRKEPNRRYASVERLARDVRRHLAGEPVEAAPDSRRYRAGKFLRRHRTGVLVVAGVVLTLAAGLVATLLQARVARIERERAERRFNEVRGLARSMISEVYDAIEPLPGSTAARELLLRSALGYLDRIASEPGAEASLQRELARGYVRIGNVQGYGGVANLGQQTAAIESYGKALKIHERLARAAPSDRTAQDDLAATHRSLGGLLRSVGEAQAALAHFQKAVSLHESLAAGRPGDRKAEAALAWSYVALSDGLNWRTQQEQSLALLHKALALFRRTAEADPRQVRLQRAMATTYRRIGRIQALRNNPTLGIEAYRSALAIDERRLAAEPNTPEARLDVSADVNEVAKILLIQGDPAAALAQAERARAMREDLVRADPADTHARVFLADALDAVALSRWRLGERPQALEIRRSTLQHLETLAAVQPGDVNVQVMLAVELAELGVGYAEVDAGRSRGARCARAHPFLVRALDAYQRLAAKDLLAADATPSLADVEAALARCAASR